MKQILLFFSLVASFVALSQVPQKNSTFFEFDRFTVNQLGIPQDTVAPPAGQRNRPWLAGKDSILYMWSPSLQRFVRATGAGGTGSGVWGGLAGSINSQTDLINKFSQYQPIISQGTPSQYLKADLSKGNFQTDVRGAGIGYFNPLITTPADIPGMDNYIGHLFAADGRIGYNPNTRKFYFDTTGLGGGGGADTAALNLQARLNQRQLTLVSGSSIKTINGQNLLGSGDVIISGGGSEPQLQQNTILGKNTSGTGNGKPIFADGKTVQFDGDTLKTQLSYSVKAAGITGAGDKTSALNAEASSNTRKTILFDENQTYTLSGSYNGQGKRHRFENGAKFTGGTVTNILIDAPPGIQVFDTSVAVASVANTDIYPAHFGFSATASAAQNLRALQRICDLVNSMGGGVNIYFEKGLYTVGKEVFAGSFGKYYAYFGSRLLDIHGCTKPVVIYGNGAQIKLVDDLHYGSFNPSTGAVYNPGGGTFANLDYRAQPGSMFWFENNASVSVENLVLNGNVDKMRLGGYFGDAGVQLEADGIAATDNGELRVTSVKVMHAGRDGIYVANTTQDTTAKKNVFIHGCTFDGNGRQGLSWVGGNHIEAVGNQFINTGKTVNLYSGNAFYSAPAAGIDIESEAGWCRNGLFDNNFIYNNEGVGIVNDGANTTRDVTIRNTTIIGTGAAPIYGLSKRMHYDNCTIVGMSLSMVTAGTTGADDPDNARFDKCTFTLDTLLSPNGKVYGNLLIDMGGGGTANFFNCTFDSKERNTVYGGYQCNFHDCTFKRDSTKSGTWGTGIAQNFLQGRFHGTNKAFSPYNAYNPDRTSGSKFYGTYYLNNNDLSGLEADSIRRAYRYQRSITGGIEFTRIDFTKDTMLISGGGGGGSSVWSLNGSTAYYNSGTVGIGTTNANPAASRAGLVVRGNSNGGEVIIQSQDVTDGTEGGMALIAVGSTANIFNRQNGALYFGTNNTLRTTITADGNVGIGSQTPTFPASRNGLVVRGNTTNGAEFILQPNEEYELGSNGLACIVAGNNASVLNRMGGVLSLGTNNTNQLSFSSSSATFSTPVATASLQITGGSPGSGKVLTSDASGNATWQSLPSTSGFEQTSNKATSLASPDNTKYPTTQAITNYISSGTYTPTVYGGDATATASVCQYMKIGNQVSVDGSISVTASAGGAATVVTITLPTASGNFTNFVQAAGTCVLFDAGDNISGRIAPTNAAQTVSITYTAYTTNTTTVTFHFQYTIQ